MILKEHHRRMGKASENVGFYWASQECSGGVVVWLPGSFDISLSLESPFQINGTTCFGYVKTCF